MEPGHWRDGVQAIQLRPGMYAGDTSDGTGLHNLLYAVLDNAVAQALYGGASRVAVDLYPDGSCAVSDNGQGMPIVAFEGDARPFPERVLTQFLFGMKHGAGPFRAQTIQNTGLVPVNALSSWLDLRTVKDGIEYLVRFESGRLARPLAAVAPSERRLPVQGTTISFLPDASIFTPSAFDVETIGRTLGTITAAAGVVVTLTDHRGSGESPWTSD